MISTTLSFRLLIRSPAFSKMLLILPSVVFIFVIVFFNSAWYFLIFSVPVAVLTVFIHSSEFGKHIYDHYLNTLSDRLLILLSFNSFYNVFSCSLICDIFLCLLILPLCVSLYKLVQLHFTVLKECSYVGDVLWGPEIHH